MHVRSRTDARRLAQELPVTFVVFDVLRRYGVDLTPRPWQERRDTLDRWLGEDPAWTVSPSFDDGAATEAAARQNGLEGVVAKRVTSSYRPGVRSRDWVKLRFVRTGDFAVIGWEAPADSAKQLSSLLLARRGADGLVFCGKVGSGLGHRESAALAKSLDATRDAGRRGHATPARRVA